MSDECEDEKSSQTAVRKSEKLYVQTNGHGLNAKAKKCRALRTEAT